MSPDQNASEMPVSPMLLHPDGATLQHGIPVHDFVVSVLLSESPPHLVPSCLDDGGLTATLGSS